MHVSTLLSSVPAAALLTCTRAHTVLRCTPPQHPSRRLCRPHSAASSAASSVPSSQRSGAGVAYLRRENLSLREELEELKGTVSRLQAAAAGSAAGGVPSWQVQARTSSTQGEGDAEAALEAARRESAALEAAAALREEVRDLKSNLMAAKTEAADAAALREQLDVLRSASSRAAEAETALAAARKRIQDLEDVSEAHSRLSASHEKLSASHSDLQREAGKVPKLLASLEEQKSAAVESELRATDLEMQLEAAGEHIAELQERLAAGGGAEGLEGAAVQHAVAAAPAVQTQAGGMAGGLSEFNPEVAAELETLREDNARLREALSMESSDNVMRLETLLEQTRSLKSSMEGKYKAAAKQLKGSEAAREAAEADLGRTRSALAEVQADLSDTRAERESLHARLATTTAELGSTQESLTAARRQAEEDAAAAATALQQMEQGSQAQAEEAAAALKAVQEEAAAAACAAASQAASLQHCLREVQWRTEAEVEGAQLRFAEVTEQLKADAAAQLAAELRAAAGVLESYKAEHSVSTEEWEAAQAALEQEAREQQGVLAATRADLEEAKAEATALSAAGARLKKQLADTKAALAGVEGQLRSTKAALAKSQADFKDWQLRSNSAGGMGGSGGAGSWETMEHLKSVQETVGRLETENTNLKRNMTRNGYSSEAIASAAAGGEASGGPAADGAALPDAEEPATAGAAKRMTRSQAASASSSASSQLRTAQAEISSLQQDKTALQQQVSRLMLEEVALREKGKRIVGSLNDKIKALEVDITRKSLDVERVHRAAQMAGVTLDGMRAPAPVAAGAVAAVPPRMVTDAAPAGSTARGASTQPFSVPAATEDDDDEFNTSVSELTGHVAAPAAPAVGSSLLSGAGMTVPVRVKPATAGNGGITVSQPTVARTSVIRSRGTVGARKSVYGKRLGGRKPSALAARPANA